MNYAIDAVALRRGRVDDGMRFEPARASVRAGARRG